VSHQKLPRDEDGRSEVEAKLPLRVELLGLGAILMSLVAFHLLSISRQPFFIDEMCELVIAKFSVGKILTYADSMPPLYSILLKGWLGFWGTDAAARWLSALFGLLTVVAVWWFVRRLVSGWAGLASAAVLTVLPLQLFYTQFVRSYALFALLSTLAIGFFAIATMENKRAAWIGFVVAAVVGVFTHYYFVLLLVSLGVIWIAASRGRVGWPFVWSVVAVGVLASPVLVCLKSDFEYQKHLRDPRPLDAAAAAYTYVTYYSGYSLGPSKSDLQTLSAREAAKQMMPWGIAILGCSVPVLLLGFTGLARRRLAWAIAAICVLPIVLTGLLGFAAGVTYNIRFVAWVSAPLSVCLGVGIAHGGRRLLTWLPVTGLLVIAAIAIGNRHLVERYQNEDLRSAASYIATHGSPDDQVIIVSDYLANVLGYYLPPGYSVTTLPDPGGTNQAVKTKDEAERLIQSRLTTADSRRNHLWLIYSRPFHGDPAGHLLEALKSSEAFDSDHPAKRFSGVQVYLAHKP